MPRETDLLRVKLVAHTLLDAQIQETALSPVIVSHPFTNSGISALRNEDGSLSMVDLINNSDDCTRWRRKVGEQIDSAENVHQIFVLLTGRNESEAIVDPRHLEQIMESPEPQFDMQMT